MNPRGKTQGAGARALESALAVPGVSLATLARDGLLRSLTLAHQRCPQSRSVALSLCRVMGKARDPKRGSWERKRGGCVENAGNDVNAFCNHRVSEALKM